MEAGNYANLDPNMSFGQELGNSASFYGNENNDNVGPLFDDESLFNSYVDSESLQDPSSLGFFGDQGQGNAFTPALQNFPTNANSDVAAQQQFMNSMPDVNLSPLQTMSLSQVESQFNIRGSYQRQEASASNNAMSSHNTPQSNTSPANTQQTNSSPFENYQPSPEAQQSSTVERKIPKKRGRKKNIPKDEEERAERRNKFLERNRIAAAKCREKKKEWMSDMEHKKVLAERESVANREIIALLSQELSQLIAVAKAHMQFGCDDKTLHDTIERLSTSGLGMMAQQLHFDWKSNAALEASPSSSATDSAFESLVDSAVSLDADDTDANQKLTPPTRTNSRDSGVFVQTPRILQS